MFRPARSLARAVRAISRRLGRSGGTTAPGRMLLRLSPGALGRMAGELQAGSVLVSATNGKTTSSAMLAEALERGGRQVVHNRAGSNMAWGVATALLDAGAEPGQLGIFEVDEAWLPHVAHDLEPRLLLLSNLFRDQLDRYGELELIADRWAQLVAELDGRARFVLNADDPLVADLGRDRQGVTYYGVEDDSQALLGMQHAADSKHCRNCGTPYEYEAIYLGHLGRYSCPGCGRKRPPADVAAVRVELDGMTGSRVGLRTPHGELSLRLPLPGLYNVYNAVAAAATALELGVPLAGVGAALEGFSGSFGRVETIEVAGRRVSILLIKNPAGANEVLRTLLLEPGRLDLWIALNDRTADGRDISWVWDADFELLAGRVQRVTCSGTRAEEMALRLKYAGIDGAVAVERELEASLDSAVAAAADGARLYALPTYTALLDLRELLARRGLAKRWSE
ncbi:MAG TPA: MurT ligase domain-containing protein [Thermoleophilaceae bacterium]|nr:MurT ligase domain-containing protein [Thermoleophilaceae bacterium]